MVSASAWSCVTYTVVTPSSRTSAEISARSSARSPLSRLDRGSSIRKSDGPADDRPAHRDPLPLAAGELPGLARQHVADAERAGHVGHPLRPGDRLQPGDPQREADVVPDRHMRIETEVLEDHGDLALPRRQVVGDLAVEQDDARGRVLQSGDHAQHGRLAAARGAEQHHELAVGDVKTDVVDGDSAVAEYLRHVRECDGGHSAPPAAAETGCGPHPQRQSTHSDRRKRPRPSGKRPMCAVRTRCVPIGQVRIS